MAKVLLFLTVALLLGLTTSALAAEGSYTAPLKEDTLTPNTENKGGEGKTGPNAECPITKTIRGKIYCFQNDPALNKPQGGG